MSEEGKIMDGAARREFLAGLFAGWYAKAAGREKPNADDRKRAQIVADGAADTFHFYRQQRERREAAQAVTA